MKASSFILLCTALTVSAVEKNTEKFSFAVNHEKASFAGSMMVSADGPETKAKVSWQGEIRNTSSKLIHRAEFCVLGTNKAGTQYAPGGQECLINLWTGQWAPGATLTFKGSQRLPIGDSKNPASIASISVKAVQVYDEPPNSKLLSASCSLLWPHAIRSFGDRKFRPTVLDKDSLTATFAFDGGQVTGYSSSSAIKAYTTANTAFLGPTWEAFRADSASLYLREEGVGACKAEIKMAYAGLAKPFLSNRYQWYALDSNLALERQVLADLEAAASKAVTAERDKGIAEIGKDAPKSEPIDVEAKLANLVKMMQSGLLTQEEFQAAKKKLLGQ